MTKRNITCIDLTNDEESNSFYKDFLTQNRDIWLSKKTFDYEPVGSLAWMQRKLGKPYDRKLLIKPAILKQENTNDCAPCTSSNSFVPNSKRTRTDPNSGNTWWINYQNQMSGRLQLPTEPRFKTVSVQTDPIPEPVWVCSVCMEASQNRVIWNCTHIFCNECSERMVYRRYGTRQNLPTCPLCRTEFRCSIPLNNNLL